MKIRFSTILTCILVIALIAGAVFIGGVKGYQEEREELLLACMDRHVNAGSSLSQSIEQCEEDARDFDARLKYKMMGQVADVFGVEPISDSVAALHAQLSGAEIPVGQAPAFLDKLGAEVNSLLEDNIDTKLSLSKIFWTVVLLWFIFGRKGRRGITLGKLLAGFGLFRIWRKK